MAMTPIAQPERQPQFEVFCPPEKPLLNILRRFVSNVAEEMGFANDEISKIEMAVDEACSNVLQHAYPNSEPPDQRKKVIQLKLHMDPCELTIHILDCGKGSQSGYRGSSSIPEYQLPDRDKYGGLGILIMREFMDEVQFMTQPGEGTRVTLRKSLKSG